MSGKKSKAVVITLAVLVVLVAVCAIGYYYAQIYVINKMRSIITKDVQVQIEALLDELVEREGLAQDEAEATAADTKSVANKAEKRTPDALGLDSESPKTTQGTEAPDEPLETPSEGTQGEQSTAVALSEEEKDIYVTARETVPISDQLRGLELIERVDIDHALELAEPGLGDKQARKELKEYAYSIYSKEEIQEVYDLYHKYKYMLD